jgi:hypothetical protein
MGSPKTTDIDLTDNLLTGGRLLVLSSDKSPRHQSCDILLLLVLIQKLYIIPNQTAGDSRSQNTMTYGGSWIGMLYCKNACKGF